MKRARPGRERGAAAVEFALLLPLLLLIVFGIIDFGRALNTQITLTQAAREGARLAALGQTCGSLTTPGTVLYRTQTAATGLNLGQAGASVSCTTCPQGAGPTVDGTVAISYPFSFVTPISAISTLFGNGITNSYTLNATGVVPCET